MHLGAAETRKIHLTNRKPSPPISELNKYQSKTTQVCSIKFMRKVYVSKKLNILIVAYIRDKNY